MKVVTIGGVATGPKAGAKISRLCPGAEVKAQPFSSSTNIPQEVLRER